MNNVWWNQISRARHFVDEILECLVQEKSLVLCLPELMPYYPDFQEIMQDTLRQEKGNRRVMVVDCPEGEVGPFLLEKFCKKEKRSSYRYGITYAQFLGESEDITLNDCYLWVRGVSKKKGKEWISFIDEYLKAAASHPAAVFILEGGEELSNITRKGIKAFSFKEAIDAYDRFAFCALTVSDNTCREAYRPYLAELVSNLCEEDVELCEHCAKLGTAFLKSPREAFLQILEKERRSDGKPFEMKTDIEWLTEKTWESQIRILFPCIEQYRKDFTSHYEKEIAAGLPIQDSYGNVIENPQEIEVGVITSLIGRKLFTVTMEEYEELVLFKNARNDLAHLDVVPWESAERIITWKKRNGK